MTFFSSILDALPIQSGNLNFASNGLQQPILLTETGNLILLWNGTIFVISGNGNGNVLGEVSLATLTNGLPRNPPNGFVGLDQWAYVGNQQIAYFDNYANNGLGIISYDAQYRFSIEPQAARYATYVAAMASVPSGTFSNYLNGNAYFIANQNNVNHANAVLNIVTGAFFFYNSALQNGNMLLSSDGYLYVSNLSSTNNLYAINPHGLQLKLMYMATSVPPAIYNVDDGTYLYASPTPNLVRFNKQTHNFDVQYLGTQAYTNIVGAIGGFIMMLDFENGSFLKAFWQGSTFIQGATYQFPDTAPLGNTFKLFITKPYQISMIYQFRSNGNLPIGIFDLSESLYYQIFPTFVQNYSWINRSNIALKQKPVYFNLQTAPRNKP